MMNKIYSPADLDAVKRQRTHCLIFFFAVTAVYLAVAITLFVFYVLEYVGSPRIPYFKAGVYVSTGLYVIFAYIYMSIRFSRVRRYAKLLRLILVRTPTSGTATFMRFNSDLSVKDGVDFKSMTLVEWSDKEKEYMERYILLDAEKPLPDFREGDEISFKTYANILTQYEILHRTKLAGTPFENI